MANIIYEKKVPLGYKKGMPPHPITVINDKIKKYFIITDGTSLIEKSFYVDKEGARILIKMYDAIDELNLPTNMALCDTKKEVSKLIKKWGFTP